MSNVTKIALMYFCLLQFVEILNGKNDDDDDEVKLWHLTHQSYSNMGVETPISTNIDNPIVGVVSSHIFYLWVIFYFYKKS